METSLFNSRDARDLRIGQAVFQAGVQRKSDLCKVHVSVRKSEMVIVI